ncbi:uncharacterized protein LOC111715142 [Eurytemora carolleeae]|uniref:uncharacterized protein LOC111715142 n=1 Tax=Eurytemora carolleeae TaxID=1294199 RepID=UPI000C759CF0|nr:uncharacterized protein LOC111715142 [Eurytemora carolleeae]|eukprot:XP_023346177.1 uncharacterized protein LOC111715142 [Eurytemora affinis]
MVKKCSLYLVLLLLQRIQVSPAFTVGGMKCYTSVDVDDKEDGSARCEERRGFRSCFTKYDSDGAITGRGCATKDKIFGEVCENHLMAGKQERICYCSKFLCNGSSLHNQTHFLIVIVLMPLAFLFH